MDLDQFPNARLKNKSAILSFLRHAFVQTKSPSWSRISKNAWNLVSRYRWRLQPAFLGRFCQDLERFSWNWVLRLNKICSFCDTLLHTLNLRVEVEFSKTLETWCQDTYEGCNVTFWDDFAKFSTQFRETLRWNFRVFRSLWHFMRKMVPKRVRAFFGYLEQFSCLLSVSYR